MCPWWHGTRFGVFIFYSQLMIVNSIHYSGMKFGGYRKANEARICSMVTLAYMEQKTAQLSFQ